jgi:glycosyltransferase involved in cell wall biosynthesis
MSQEGASPRISVVIPTFNRSSLLRSSLESLAHQTLPPQEYELVVVNDGSSDATEEVCQELAQRVRLRYFCIKNSGISAAKNLGVFAAAAPLLLFFDDDDIATPNLLEEHLRAHREHPDTNVAVLGYTCWAPSVCVSPVMEYVLDVGQLLFAYKNLHHGQKLDYTYFWGGRTSCKRSFLVAHGVFNQVFRSIIEDIELGYRLSKFGLSVVYHRLAVSRMVRPITYEEFCRRCDRQGAALFQFSRLHPDPAVEQYCRIGEANACWGSWKDRLGMGFYRVREIEALLECEPDSAQAEPLRRQLPQLYNWTFNCFKARGIVRAQERAAGSLGNTEKADSPVVRPIVVYQMAKVGSKSVEESLKAHDLGVPVCHSHLLNDLDRVERDIKTSRVNPRQTLAEVNHGKQLRKCLLGTNFIRCQVVSLVRDPVARNISAFFESIAEFIPDFRPGPPSGGQQVEELIATFLDRYDHDTPLRWFDHQMKPVFGIDVFARAFPKERGYGVYDGPNASLLVIKLEKMNACVGGAMRDFLGLEKFVLGSANVADHKGYGAVYRTFLDAIELPSSYMDRMYESQFARHFYSEEEIGAFRRRWLKPRVHVNGPLESASPGCVES